jgi:hypothetical protein
VHFEDGHTYQAWSGELAIHHAGIPLALFVLLQDFRFVLLDAFVRFLVNGLLAGVFGLAVAASLPGMSFLAQALTAGLLLTAFAVSRDVAQRFLTRIIFRQPDPERTSRTLQSLRSECTSESDYLAQALQQVARLMTASLIDVVSKRVSSEDLLVPAIAGELPEYRDLQDRGVRAIVPIRLSHGDTRYALLGERKGGQPYLSEDLALVARMAASIIADPSSFSVQRIEYLVWRHTA